MSANIDLVTSHKGAAHITTQNVIDLIAGLSGNIAGIKIFPDTWKDLDKTLWSRDTFWQSLELWKTVDSGKKKDTVSFVVSLGLNIQRCSNTMIY